jgi:hypothetical protein
VRIGGTVVAGRQTAARRQFVSAGQSRNRTSSPPDPHLIFFRKCREILFYHSDNFRFFFARASTHSRIESISLNL